MLVPGEMISGLSLVLVAQDANIRPHTIRPQAALTAEITRMPSFPK